MNKYKIYQLFLLAILLTTVMTGCSSQTANKSGNNSNEDIAKTTTVDSSANNDITDGLADTDVEEYTSLAIGSGCIGCNHCIRFDSEHFAKNQNSRIPEIISQENLNSSALKMAINNCPVKVISLK